MTAQPPWAALERALNELSARFFTWIDQAPPWQFAVAAIVPAMLIALVIQRRRALDAANPVFARIGGMIFRERHFFRHFFITGSTGSGKTEAAINRLMFEVFKNVPGWGGCVLDEKGVAHQDVMAFATHAGRAGDVIVLQSPPENAAPDWQPPHTWNPLLDTRFPDSTHAELLIRTAAAVRRAESKDAFWEPTAIAHIEKLLTGLRLSNGAFPVAITTIVDFLTDQRGRGLEQLAALLVESGDPLAQRISDHFRYRFLGLDSRLLDNIRGTIAAYLTPFCEPTLAPIFCGTTSSFNVADVDTGKIVCFSVSPKFKASRIHYSALLKNLICEHAHLRFTLPKAELDRTTPLILWMDEAQLLVSGDPQRGDHTYASVLRQARLAFVMATQDPVLSLIPALGRDMANTLKLNLGNQIHFQAASQEAGEWVADVLGKREVHDVNTSHGPTGTTRSRNRLAQQRHWIEASTLRRIKPFRAILRHANGNFTKQPITVPPVTHNGKAPVWF